MTLLPGRPAKKSLSQNFLVDPNLQRKIVDALEAGAEDRVLEIGPGTGALTRHLAGRVAHLTLVELDDEMADELARRYAGRPDVEVIHGDIMKVSLANILEGRATRGIGNIPYGITTPLIFHILEARETVDVVVLTVQKEVALRLVASPGTKEYGALSVGVRAIATVERLFDVPRTAFRPRPDVDSTVVRIRPISPAPLSAQEEIALRTLTRAAFSRRRKQLQKVLRQAPEYRLSSPAVEELLAGLAIDPAVRPDALPVPDYVRLARVLGRSVGGGSGGGSR